MLITLKSPRREAFIANLQSYRAHFQKDPDASARTEAFSAALSLRKPHWER